MSGGVRVEPQGVAEDEAVVHDALHVDRADADADHVGVARDVVEVVDGCRPAEDRLAGAQPARWLVPGEVGGRHHPCHRPGVDPLAGSEGSRRCRAQLGDEVTQLVDHQPPPDVLMVDAIPGKNLAIEEVTEGPVTDIVEQARQPQRRLDQRRRRGVGEGGTQ